MLPRRVRREQGRGENKVTQSETIGTGVREGEGVKDGVWSSRGLSTALCPLPIFATMILWSKQAKIFQLYSLLFSFSCCSTSEDWEAGRFDLKTLGDWEAGWGR